MTVTTTQDAPEQTLMARPRNHSRSLLIAAYRPPVRPTEHRERPGEQYQLAVPSTEWEVSSEATGSGVGLGVARGVGRGEAVGLGVGVGVGDSARGASSVPNGMDAPRVGRVVEGILRGMVTGS
jgi:hypothetical protein